MFRGLCAQRPKKSDGSGACQGLLPAPAQTPTPALNRHTKTKRCRKVKEAIRGLQARRSGASESSWNFHALQNRIDDLLGIDSFHLRFRLENQTVAQDRPRIFFDVVRNHKISAAHCRK